MDAKIIPEYELLRKETTRQNRPIFHTYVRFVVPIPNTDFEFHFKPTSDIDDKGYERLICIRAFNRNTKGSIVCKASAFWFPPPNTDVQDLFYTTQPIWLRLGLHVCFTCCYDLNSLIHKNVNRFINHDRWTKERPVCILEMEAREGLCKIKIGSNK